MSSWSALKYLKSLSGTGPSEESISHDTCAALVTFCAALVTFCAALVTFCAALVTFCAALVTLRTFQCYFLVDFTKYTTVYSEKTIQKR